MLPVLTGMLWMSLDDLTSEEITSIKNAYAYKHPHEEGKSFETFMELRGKLGVPYGNTSKIHKIVPIEFIKDQTVVTPVDRPISLTGLSLRDYQQKALEEATDYLKDHTSFNLSGEPGSGKSVMLSAIIAKLGVKTLIIAHLSMLTSQIMEEISQFTDANVKILNKDDMELGDITIATSQFISVHPEIWKKIKHTVGLIAVDEAESLASETTLRILQRAHARYRIAVTATFTRSVDGRTPALTDMIGHKVITLVNDKLLKPTVITIQCSEAFKKPSSKKMYKTALSKFFDSNPSITDKVITITGSSVKKDRQVLIATDIKKYQELYAVELEKLGIRCGVMNGSTSKENRDRILSEYNTGDIQVLIGFGVLNAGLSIPRISTIIRVSTPGNIEKLEQLTGRGRRNYDGKAGTWFIDLMFNGFQYANNTRRRFYSKKASESGWGYSTTTWDKFKKHISTT